MELLQEKLTIAEHLGWKMCSLEDKIEILGCKTEERLNRHDPLYIPYLMKNKYEYLTIDMIDDTLMCWETLMKLAISLGVEKMPTHKNEAVLQLVKSIKGKL